MWEAVSRHELISPQDHVLAAVSGGPDSMALLHVLVFIQTELGGRPPTVLHFNHRLRAGASLADEEIVRAAARKLGCVFRAGTEDVGEYRRKHRISLEMAARACRHRFFDQARKELGGTKIALGHTANDQAEEILLRLIRGSGPSGLCGMAPKGRSGIIRPLLGATREQILAYLEDRRISYSEDPSNSQPFCQRNVLRLKIFPTLLRRFHPKAIETLCRHAELVRRDETYWRQRILECWPSVCLEETSAHIRLDAEALLEIHPPLRVRVMRWAVERFRGSTLGLYTPHWDAMCRWVSEAAERKTLHLPARLRLTRCKKAVVLWTEEPKVSPKPGEAAILIPGPGTYTFSGYSIALSVRGLREAEKSGGHRVSSQEVCLDAGTISWPMWIRFWKEGDRFRPLGLGGSKKLQDYFTDCKVPRAMRHRIPLLCDGEKICWVVGHRLDERVKVTSSTQEVLVVEIRSIEAPTREDTADPPRTDRDPGSLDPESLPGPSGDR